MARGRVFPSDRGQESVATVVPEAAIRESSWQPLWHGLCCCTADESDTNMQKRGAEVTIHRRELLVFVAIVTSAVVIQILQHDIDENVPVERTRALHETVCNPAVSNVRKGYYGRTVNQRAPLEASA
jgi:hypothetical protein